MAITAAIVTGVHSNQWDYLIRAHLACERLLIVDICEKAPLLMEVIQIAHPAPTNLNITTEQLKKDRIPFYMGLHKYKKRR